MVTRHRDVASQPSASRFDREKDIEVTTLSLVVPVAGPNGDEASPRGTEVHPKLIWGV